MTKYRSALPQLRGGLFLTDGGLETTLIFHDGVELPLFASFALLRTADGIEHLRRYYESHAAIAVNTGAGFILEGATWRANPDWGAKLGCDAEGLAKVDRASVQLMSEIRERFETPESPFVISGNIGPRGDGYMPEQTMTAAEAADYHDRQIRTFADTEADLVTAMTMTHSGEAAGIALAARSAQMPAVLSFTVETNGRLPSGESLPTAIGTVDAASDGWPAYYMINCAHPDHFARSLEQVPWMNRVRGIRANASRRSHAELNDSTDLDDGNPVELGREYAEIRSRYPHINVLGGCCGTDHRHVAEIAAACGMMRAAPRLAV